MASRKDNVGRFYTTEEVLAFLHGDSDSDDNSSEGLTYNDERPDSDDSSLESGSNEKRAKYVHDPAASCSGNVSSTMTENSDVRIGEESLLEYSGIVCGNSESETSQDNNSTSDSEVDEGEGSSYSGSDACSCSSRHSVDNVEFDVDSISYDKADLPTIPDFPGLYQKIGYYPGVPEFCCNLPDYTRSFRCGQRSSGKLKITQATRKSIRKSLRPRVTRAC
jgi:hypothetical protein